MQYQQPCLKLKNILTSFKFTFLYICMCIYIYTYIYVCIIVIYIYIHTQYIYTYIHLYTDTYLHKSISVNLYTVLDIIFQNFTVFQYKSNSPQVKRDLIASITNFVYELPHKLPSHLRLWKLRNIRKISNQGGHIAQCPVSLPETKVWQQQLKNTQKYISCPVQFYQTFYFVANIQSEIIIYI